jgi:hypothetical protein
MPWESSGKSFIMPSLYSPGYCSQSHKNTKSQDNSLSSPVSKWHLSTTSSFTVFLQALASFSWSTSSSSPNSASHNSCPSSWQLLTLSECFSSSSSYHMGSSPFLKPYGERESTKLSSNTSSSQPLNSPRKNKKSSWNFNSKSRNFSGKNKKILTTYKLTTFLPLYPRSSSPAGEKMYQILAKTISLNFIRKLKNFCSKSPASKAAGTLFFIKPSSSKTLSPLLTPILPTASLSPLYFRTPDSNF